MEEEEAGVKTRSFRDEGYSSRRIFLRSYPLQWNDDDDDDDDEVISGDSSDEDVNNKGSLKGKFVAVIHWGEGKMLLLRKLKNKVTLYLVACQPFGFKSSKKMLTM